MSAKNFRFRSPGIRIQEIDQSFVEAPTVSEVGPVIVGRSLEGPILKPVTVNSVAEFIDVFGEPSPGGYAGGDLWRSENTTAPHYGAYAALAYLRNSAPVTFIRLGGIAAPGASGTGQAGWQTTGAVDPDATLADDAGAYGLWLAPSASSGDAHGTGSLAAVFYMSQGAAIGLEVAAGEYKTKRLASFAGTLTNAKIKLAVSASAAGTTFTPASLVNELGYTSGSTDHNKTFTVTLDPSDSNFIRKAFNTSPLKTYKGDDGVNHPHPYFLGETFEDVIKSKEGTETATLAFITPLASGSVYKGDYRYDFQEAKTGWIFSQDTGLNTSFDPIDSTPQKLFRLVGLNEGRWASKNIKISIAKISYTKVDNSAEPYPTFSVQVRDVKDSDNSPAILEEFNDLTLNPRSANFIAAVIGDQYIKYDKAARKHRVFGSYPNNSRYIRVDVHPDILYGAADPELVPFGFLGPARRKKFQIISGSATTAPDSEYVTLQASYASELDSSLEWGGGDFIASNVLADTFTASLDWPDYALRVTASNSSRGVAKNGYFGVRVQKNETSRFFSENYYDLTYPLEEGVDPWEADGTNTVHTFAFSLDDVKQISGSGTGWLDNAAYKSGNRASSTAGEKSISQLGAYYKANGPGQTATALYTNSTAGWKTVIDAGYNKFTMPMHGGFDGVDITKKNPFSNVTLTGGSTNDGQDNYAWYSVFTAIKALKDPEFIDYDIAAVPGVWEKELNKLMAEQCLERGDALAVIDLDSGYRPLEETKEDSTTAVNTDLTKLGSVSSAVNWRRNDMSDLVHSYACTFYPWVDISDPRAGALVSVPPSVAMLGVFGRVKQVSDVWFAPAGFNRGGLSDGLSGYPVVSVKDRLTSNERDELYDNGINPIASFPAEGVVVFGQKTLQLQRSALDRINVRRLMIYLKRQISRVASSLLFEPNVPDTWRNFTNDAEEILQEVQDGLGIEEYRFILDETTTTPDLVDQNTLYAKLLVKPTRAIEFIALDFVLTNSGVDFPE